MSFVAFHYRSYGTFFYTQKSSIISMVDLPTTDIIEPKISAIFLCNQNSCYFLQSILYEAYQLEKRRR
ncbi:hypothetical protein A7J09_10460 [Streptococcus suis]